MKLFLASSIDETLPLLKQLMRNDTALKVAFIMPKGTHGGLIPTETNSKNSATK